MHETCDNCLDSINNLKKTRKEYLRLEKQLGRKRKLPSTAFTRLEFLKKDEAVDFISLRKNNRTIRIQKLQDQIVEFKCGHNVVPKDIMPFIRESIIEEYEEYLKEQPKGERFNIQAKIVSPAPHRTSRGTTTNHWKTGIHLSLYIKDKWWYTNKLRRMSKSRDINLTPTQSIKLLDRVKTEDTLRWEVTIWGFEQIHNEKNHRLITDLEQFIVQTVQYFKNNKHIIDLWKKAISDIRKILPKALYSEEYETLKEKLY